MEEQKYESKGGRRYDAETKLAAASEEKSGAAIKQAIQE
jgi:hypothetical protein